MEGITDTTTYEPITAEDYGGCTIVQYSGGYDVYYTGQQIGTAPTREEARQIVWQYASVYAVLPRPE
jgi:hypothetical protein